ncbi:lysophospholipase L1-like esterase [Diaminobutyricimonas aerilata]|uniref:Lysophospholipase L1-like esterase n=1 Tax=Diaminobutyricimonas aerilata TaxID=1162967 RepID=A0A2M9CN83_9MICO|nr:SGNH/GDSL hydrolase family protein [Diaminobutyricimonas aerilata]PJJ73363.1 lysophospholipase L1-like esterase [Diaminobutyricimonas aerilata]
MPWFLVAIVVALGGGIAGWVRWLVRRRGVWFIRLNDAIPVNAHYWRERMARHGEYLYVAIGDSAAQGIGASRPGRSYVGMIARHVRTVSPAKWRVANLSVSGATVSLALKNQLPKLRKLEPDLCTVAIGANDIAAFDPERFERDLRALYSALPSHTIVADVPCFYFNPRERIVRQANEILRRVAGEFGLEVVPLHELTRRQGARGIVTQFAGDLFHPNDRGYAVWARAFEPAVDARLRSTGLGAGALDADDPRSTVGDPLPVSAPEADAPRGS